MEILEKINWELLNYFNIVAFYTILPVLFVTMILKFIEIKKLDSKEKYEEIKEKVKNGATQKRLKKIFRIIMITLLIIVVCTTIFSIVSGILYLLFFMFMLAINNASDTVLNLIQIALSIAAITVCVLLAVFYIFLIIKIYENTLICRELKKAIRGKNNEASETQGI